MESTRAQQRNNIMSSSQVPPPINLVPLKRVNINTKEIEEYLELMRETRTQIVMLNEIKIMIYNEKYDKKFILICPSNFLKISIDIRHASTLR